MGFCRLEVLMSSEYAFGVAIPSEQAGGLSTLGDLSDCIWRKLGGSTQHCLVGSVFYRMRRAIAEVCGMRRSEIRPKTQMRRLRGNPRRIRRRLSELTGLALPGLEQPRWLKDLVGLDAVLATVGVCGALFTWRAFSCSTAAFIVVTSLVVSYAALLYASRPLANTWPDDCRTVGDAARVVLGLNVHELVATGAKPSRADVWRVVRGIVCDVGRMRPEEVTPETGYARGLG